ncbi:putative endopeptidase [Lachnospiraceae bacterium]|nr:putative endopeptidase [Lachnospiraceae bacterium]
MKIKKVDDKPMVIHTKEKPKLKIKGAPETKIKGRNVLTVRHGPKTVQTVTAKSAEPDGKIKLKKGIAHVADKRKTGQTRTPDESIGYMGRNNTVQDRRGNRTVQGRNADVKAQGRQESRTIPDGSVYGNIRNQNQNATVQGRRESAAVQGRNETVMVQGRREAVASQGRSAANNTHDGRGKEHEVRQSVNRENRMYAQYRKSKAEKEAAVKKKAPVPAAVVSVAAGTALDEMEGGSEIHDAYMAAYTLAKPATNAVDAGRNLYRSQVAKAKKDKLRKKQSRSRIKEKAVKESAVKKARKTAQTAAKETAKETGKKAAKETSKAAAKTAAATAGTGAGGILVGTLAGEAVGIEMDKRDVKNSTRSRMIKLFVAKMRQEDNQDNIGKALKDIVLMRFSMMAKYIVKYVGLFLLALFAIVALIALPVIAVIAVIYNSPFAIFFPSISSGKTTQEVLSAYMSEFNDEVNAELNDHAGYDTSEKIYVNYEGSGTPDNFCDILMVYMVKHGDGDTATDMTDKAKQNLKAVFDDMCSYTITSRTDTDTDDEGNTTTTTVKEVNVELKTCYDMVSVYGFNAEEQAVLAELMKPEYLAMIGYTGGGGGGDPGEAISPEQYQAIVDAISDENGKKVVAFALSKVGYPYSQAYRDSGDYYDCSSLAYYAWRSAGVSIMYEGSNTAASEGKLCYDNNLLVNYDEMQPGDLIFYSYERNGRFMNISHVAIYAGNGKVVEAANTRLGVVYRPVQGRSSIVFIGRPR